MGDISDHFNRYEFACRCGCGFDTVDAGLITALEEIRGHFGVPVTITSGCRCEAHNAAVGGSKGSQHRLGRAADFSVQGTPPEAVRAFLETAYPDSLGVGIYSSWTHVDSRNTMARWDG